MIGAATITIKTFLSQIHYYFFGFKIPIVFDIIKTDK